ncbi:hypothetical protein IU468_26750 [Nocardia farcinica]|uniref:hypothetical protein n=1 Tax=Nocardia farcinica TaxID=37329 RepID=UPI0018936BBC|nr:hypothetical protein [Nocardia farcinica]MBF6259882.1 hypothetical protein [Nocardia farcinica]
MTTASNGDENNERSVGASGPEWAPLEPLPSSEMFLAAFNGKPPLTAADILDPAFDLVACQKQYRLAYEVLGNDTASAEQLRHAASELVIAQTDIEVLIAIIDDAVTDRLRQYQLRRDRAPSPPRASLIDEAVAVHTESIGEIAARMADLWETVTIKANQPDCDDLPEAHQLVELCKGYDHLAAEIETGWRLPPGV